MLRILLLYPMPFYKIRVGDYLIVPVLAPLKTLILISVNEILLTGYTSLATPVDGPSNRTLASSKISATTASFPCSEPKLMSTTLPGSTNLVNPYKVMLARIFHDETYHI